jgi:hypothetical protein
VGRLVVAVVAASLLAGCGASEPTTGGPPPATTVTAGSGPRIAGTDLDGMRVDVADFRGTPVFVNVWSSW